MNSYVQNGINPPLALADKTKKVLSKKKGLPLAPRYAGMCTFSTKYLRHQLV